MTLRWPILSFRLLIILFLVFSFKLRAESEHAYFFSIPAGTLSSALANVSATTEKDFIASSSLLKGIQIQQIDGTYSLSQILALLLRGTALEYELSFNGSIIIRKKKAPAIPVPKLEELVITGLKREQKSQSVPVSVSGYIGEQLSRQGLTNTRELFKVTPAVSYHGAISSAGQGMRIRGIGSAVIASGVEQSVGTIIDGVVTGPSGSGLQELWDVERVEVLRGPQGTMFGKNVSAGAISQITKDPITEFDALLSGRYEFAYDGHRLDGFISNSINNNLSYRIAFFDQEQKKGTIKNIVKNQWENVKNRQGIRLKLHYESQQFWVKLSSSYNTKSESCCARVFTHFEESYASDFAQTWAIPALEQHNIDINKNNFYSITEGLLREESKTWHNVLELGKELDNGHILKSISGNRDWKQYSENDPDNIHRDVISSAMDKNHLTIYSQEFQFISPTDGNWEYILGTFYYNQHYPKTEIIGMGFEFADTLGTTSGNTFIDSTVDVEHTAIFGNTSYKLHPKIAVFSGLRIQNEKISAVGRQYGDNWLWPTDYSENRVKDNDADWMGNLGLQYFSSMKNNQIYTSVSRGYKGKAVGNSSNSIFFRAPVSLGDGRILTADQALLNPETVLSYEIGSKNYFLDKSLLLNIVYFYSTFKDFQASAFDGNSSSFSLINAGTLKTQGLELEFKSLLWRGAALDGYVALIDAYFKEFTGAPCRARQISEGSCSNADGGQNLSGEPLNETPERQYGIHFEQILHAWGGDIVFDLYYSWRDDVIFDTDLDPNTQQDAYGLLDVAFSYEQATYSIRLFTNNLANQAYSNRIIDAPFWQGAYQSYPGEGRTYGFDISYRFY